MITTIIIVVFIPWKCQTELDGSRIGRDPRPADAGRQDVDKKKNKKLLKNQLQTNTDTSSRTDYYNEHK